MTWRPCTVCGEPCDGYRCDEHQPPPPPKRSAHARGYDYTWAKLSERARRLQPFCSFSGLVDPFPRGSGSSALTVAGAAYDGDVL